MRLALHILGTEVLALTFGSDETAIEYEDDEPGSCTSTPIGFTPSHGDVRWSEHEVPEEI